MKLLDAHAKAMSSFDARVRGVRADQWDAPTPCTDWSVRVLVNHLVSQQLWAPPLLAGSTVEQVGDRFDGDVLGADPLKAWTRAADAARGAWHRPGVLQTSVHLRRGMVGASVYGWEMTNDLAVHGWDLARAIGADEHIDDELAETLLTQMRPKFEGRQGSRAFTAPVDIPTDAGPGQQLVGLTGRNPF